MSGRSTRTVRRAHKAAGFALALVLPVLVMSSDAQADTGDEASGAGTIVGDYPFCPAGSTATFAFSASGAPDGAASGTFSFACSAFGSDPATSYSGAVSCLFVDGTDAVIGGTVTNSTTTLFVEGQQLDFTVRDGGQGGTDDRIGGYGEGASCGSPYEIATYSLVGDITVTAAPTIVPTCAAQPATIYVADGLIVGGPDTGETYAGTLNGTDGPDVIYGTPGPDTINSGAGADIVCALAGRDSVSGESDPDRLIGGAGGDNLTGGTGDDNLQGRIGNDTLTGGAGGDRFNGGRGTDTATDFQPTEGDTQVSVP